MKSLITKIIIIVLLLVVSIAIIGAASGNRKIGINVVLNTDVTNAILNDLGKFGRVQDVIVEINVVSLQASENSLPDIRALPYVAAATPDASRQGAPIDTVSLSDFTGGFSTWDLDAINVTDWGLDARQVDYDGTGVYVAVLDTGLVDNWRRYFPQERIAVEYAKSFGGGGMDNGNVSEQPNKWEHDTNSHGTHVTSTILGYNLAGLPINGVAPMATVIPVKVLGNAGFGWSSVIARGIIYVAELKDGPLAEYPVVINMSLGGPALDAAEKAAIDYAISKGVIIVASAGNEGNAGMGYPGAYEPVISVAASGWVGEWRPLDSNGVVNSSWWILMDPEDDLTDPSNPDDYYIASFSSRQKPGQDLDVAAPGSWIVGPYQLQSGKPDYYFLGGTSMASPHVAGIVALMAQKKPDLSASEAEDYLEASAIALPAGCRMIMSPSGVEHSVCWGDDATGAGLAVANGALDVILVSAPEEPQDLDPSLDEDVDVPASSPDSSGSSSTPPPTDEDLPDGIPDSTSQAGIEEELVAPADTIQKIVAPTYSHRILLPILRSSNK